MLEVPEVALDGDVVVLPVVVVGVVVISVQKLEILLTKLLVYRLLSSVFNWEIEDFLGSPLLNLDVFYVFIYFIRSCTLLCRRILTSSHPKLPHILFQILRSWSCHQLWYLLWTKQLIIILNKPIKLILGDLILSKITFFCAENSIVEGLFSIVTHIIKINFKLNML